MGNIPPTGAKLPASCQQSHTVGGDSKITLERYSFTRNGKIDNTTTEYSKPETGQ